MLNLDKRFVEIMKEVMGVKAETTIKYLISEKPEPVFPRYYFNGKTFVPY